MRFLITMDLRHFLQSKGVQNDRTNCSFAVNIAKKVLIRARIPEVHDIRLRDVYATKDTYVSAALTCGVNLTWLSEQTGVAAITLRKHYGRFIHVDAADALELAKIEATATEMVQFAPRLPLTEKALGENALIYKGKLVEQRGFEPLTPTLRTWCSPS